MVMKTMLGEYAQLGILGVAAVAILANSSSIDPEDSIPWEVTLAGTSGIMVSAIAILAKKPAAAYVVLTCLAVAAPTYYTFHREVVVHNWTFGSRHGVKATTGEIIAGAWAATPNVTRFDWMLPGGLTVMDLSMSKPSLCLVANASEIFHSGAELRDPETRAKTHDYLLVSSARKIKSTGKVHSLVTLLKVPLALEVWPQEADTTMDLQLAAGIVRPHRFIGRVAPLPSGAAVDVVARKHLLRPFLLVVDSVDFD